MTDPDHIRRELTKAMPIGAQATHVHVKARCGERQSNWVAIPVDAFRRVVATACTPEPNELRALYANLCAMHMDVVLTHGAQVGQGLALAIKEIHALLPEES